MSKNKVLVIPCSGVGKVFGLMSRETALKTVTQLRPDQASTMCLARLVTDDADAKTAIQGARCITIDGCPKLCAAKNAELAGGHVLHQVRSVDALRTHRGAQPGTATELTQDGWMMVDELAARVAELVDQVVATGGKDND